MSRYWTVSIYHNNKLDRTFKFTDQDEAFKFYNLKLSAFKHGLVGWSVNFPTTVVIVPEEYETYD